MSSKIDKAFSYMNNLEEKMAKTENKDHTDELGLKRTILCENMTQVRKI
jgi:hypothetical protein